MLLLERTRAPIGLFARDPSLVSGNRCEILFGSIAEHRTEVERFGCLGYDRHAGRPCVPAGTFSAVDRCPT